MSTLAVDNITDEVGTGSPVFPNGATISSSATVNSDAVRFDQVIGIGQTWQDLGASRSINITYTNTTGKPIQILLSRLGSGAFRTDTLLIDGVVAIEQVANANTTGMFFSAIIPNGSTYRINAINAYPKWFELR